jgi:hypothetical protein
MDDLIRRKATGTPDEFAGKLGISTSQLFHDLKEMKELGALMEYCSIRKSYHYKKECRLVIDFITDDQTNPGKCFDN